MKCAHSSSLTHKMSPAFFLQSSLSEQDVIDLSSLLLTNGVHYLQVKNMAQGRALLDTFLATFNCYQGIAYIGPEKLSPTAFKTPCIDVYEQLMSSGHVEIDATTLIEFLYTQMYCDFLWIETTQELQMLHLIQKFEDKIFELHIDAMMPIIVMYA